MRSAAAEDPREVAEIATAPRGPHRHLVFDGLRGIAAIGVLLFHSTAFTGLHLAPNGYLAVDFFFLLSGYVIGQAYGSRLADRSMSFGRFVRIRLVRFYPLYILGAALGLSKLMANLMFHQGIGFAPDALPLIVAAALVFLPSPAGAERNLFPLNVPSWSLFDELIVNVAYGALVRRMTPVALVIVAVLSFAVLVHEAGMTGNLDLGALAPDFSVGLARAVFSFSVGLLIHRAAPQRPLPGGYASAAVTLILLLVAPVPDSWRMIFDLVCVGVGFPLLLCGAAPVEIRGPLARRVSQLLGSSSYALYSIHYPLVMGAVAFGKLTHVQPLLLLVGLIVGLGMLCPALERYYDLPVRRRLAIRFGSSST